MTYLLELDRFRVGTSRTYTNGGSNPSSLMRRSRQEHADRLGRFTHATRVRLALHRPTRAQTGAYAAFVARVGRTTARATGLIVESARRSSARRGARLLRLWIAIGIPHTAAELTGVQERGGALVRQAGKTAVQGPLWSGRTTMDALALEGWVERAQLKGSSSCATSRFKDYVAAKEIVMDTSVLEVSCSGWRSRANVAVVEGKSLPFVPRRLAAGCRCSRRRVATMSSRVEWVTLDRPVYDSRRGRTTSSPLVW